MIRTYFDTGVLITAFRGKDNDLVKKAYSILDDTNRKFIVSDALKLELFPKPTFNKPKSTSNKQEVTELDFYKRIFDESEFIKISENTISNEPADHRRLRHVRSDRLGRRQVLQLLHQEVL